MWVGSGRNVGRFRRAGSQLGVTEDERMIVRRRMTPGVPDRRRFVAWFLMLLAAEGLALFAPSSQAAAVHSEVQAVQTTVNLSQHLTRVRDLWFGAHRPVGVLVIHVNDRVRYQRITGFGAAMTDSSAWLIHDELSAPARAALMNRLFSRAGIRLNFVRVPMGASDFTVGGRPYSYDDLPPGQTDPQLLHFSVTHDDAYIVPTLREMLHINPGVEILATPWSPPPWMKANEAFDDTDHLGTLLPFAFQLLAHYFVRFIQAYAARGIRIDALTPENEPLVPAGAPFPALEFPAADEANWITQDLQPALRAAGLRPKIYGHDGFGLAYPQALLSSPARSALAGIAWHCYDGLDAMSKLHAIDPGVEEILSECSPGIIPYSVSEVAIGATRDWAAAVALWNLALDPSGGPVQAPNYGCPGCTGLVTISEPTHTATLGLGYYQLGQVSKFVEAGAYRIGSERFVRDYHSPSGAFGISAGLDDVAFLNPDGGRVLVAYDNSPAPVRFAVQWHGRSFAYQLRPWATVTFTWRGTA
jgi:glucosylceramidase